MSEISKLQPEIVWRNFDLLTQVPRPSGHLEKVQQFLLDFAKKVGVEAYKDSANNIVMKKPASPGMENRKTVLLQAHMDMVPQKSPDSPHNFETDPIKTWIDGEWVKATGTTLGADDGMGIAAIMAVMEDKTLVHGPIEALCTADEETGMYGANDLPADELTADILLNLDTEDEGEMIVGSAGGININASMGFKAVETEAGDMALKVTIKGLKGGHSGLEINEGRANANKQMVRFVREAISQCDARLAEWHGGNMRNAIPSSCYVILTVPAENIEALKELVEDWKEYITEDFYGIEEGIEFFSEEVATPAEEVPADIQDNLVDAIYACHDGVLRFIPSIPDKVETSSNLAIVDITATEAKIQVLPRSSSESMKDYIVTTISSALAMAGMKIELDGGYTGWNPNPDSPMVAMMSKLYKDLFGNDAKVQVCHAGLECSIILGKYPKLDIVSFGPTLRSPHTPNERCHIPSVPKFYEFLLKTLENIPVK